MKPLRCKLRRVTLNDDILSLSKASADWTATIQLVRWYRRSVSPRIVPLIFHSDIDGEFDGCSSRERTENEWASGRAGAESCHAMPASYACLLMQINGKRVTSELPAGRQPPSATQLFCTTYDSRQHWREAVVLRGGQLYAIQCSCNRDYFCFRLVSVLSISAPRQLLIQRERVVI